MSQQFKVCIVLGTRPEAINLAHVINRFLEAANVDTPVPRLEWDRQRVILSTVHRRENWGAPLAAIAAELYRMLEDQPDMALLLPLHRNPTVREPLRAVLGNHPRAFLTEPLDYTALVRAMQRCHLVMTDSGGLQEEASSLGKPVAALRDTTERPEDALASTAKLIGTDTGRITAEAHWLLINTAAYRAMAVLINPLGDGRAAERIVAIARAYLGRQVLPKTPQPVGASCLCAP